jgi:hypothetical protein
MTSANSMQGQLTDPAAGSRQLSLALVLDCLRLPMPVVTWHTMYEQEELHTYYDHLPQLLHVRT